MTEIRIHSPSEGLTPRFTLALFAILLGAIDVFAQRANDPDIGAACGGCSVCGGSIAFMVLFFVAIIALNVALLVWVARDAKARSMDSAVIWMILVALTGLIGLLIYLFSRPQGNLVRCPHCGNNRLQASARCPHCGNG